MTGFKILYDEPQEAHWFKQLHPDLATATEESINSVIRTPQIQAVLAYDRPDIILLADNQPILVVEETVEVPSGHNVGQRFARIAAAAEAGVPSLYFGPYVAKKHGGITAGPRFMNIRLFTALEAMTRVTGTPVTTINWPVDEHSEILRGTEKDIQVRQYLEMFLEGYYSNPQSLNAHILDSTLQAELIQERNDFVNNRIKRKSTYDLPPESVEILKIHEFYHRIGTQTQPLSAGLDDVLYYQVGMRNIRSDPYTGMGILYKYLYVSEKPTRALVLSFPHISIHQWRVAAARPARKDVRLYKVASDAIVFSDGLLTKSQL